MTRQHTLKLGFIGLGLMGVPMTLRLLNEGFDVCVWNRSIAQCDALVKAGAKMAGSARQVATQCDVIMLCLSDTAAVEQVVFGQDGVASGGTTEQVLVDFSSIDPQQTRAFARRLKSLCSMAWVDAPVSGGVSGAEQGELIIMAGGDQELLASLHSVFKPLAKRVTRMGDVGAGQTTKLCNQMIVGCNAMVIAEMVAMARKAGVMVEELPAALSGGFADSVPYQVLTPQMGEHDFTLKWRVKTVLKDLVGAQDLAGELDSAVPMLQLAARLMAEHGAAGYLEKDMSTLVRCYEDAFLS